VGIIRERNTPEQRSQSGNGEGKPLDHNVYIPMSTTRSHFSETIFRWVAGSQTAERVERHQITVQMDSLAAVESANPQIRTLLKRFHDSNGYETIVPLELLRQAERIKRIFTSSLAQSPRSPCWREASAS